MYNDKYIILTSLTSSIFNQYVCMGLVNHIEFGLVSRREKGKDKTYKGQRFDR